MENITQNVPKQTMFLQTPLPHPILAVESCPPCNTVLKLVMLTGTFQRNIPLYQRLCLYNSCSDFPGLQSADTPTSPSLGIIII